MGRRDKKQRGFSELGKHKKRARLDRGEKKGSSIGICQVSLFAHAARGESIVAYGVGLDGCGRDEDPGFSRLVL